LAFDYLSSKDSLQNLLVVNKKWKALLEKKFYRLILSKPDEKLDMNVRLQIWKNIIRFVRKICDIYLIDFRTILNLTMKKLKTSIKLKTNQRAL